MFFRYTCPAVAILALSGCTAAQIESNRMQKVLAETRTSAAACLENISNKAEYAPLAAKTIVGTNHQFTLKMLTDNSLPNKTEIATFSNVHEDVQVCRKIMLDGFRAIHPRVVAPLIEAFAESDKLAIELVSGKLTWGKYNEGVKNNITQTELKLNAAGEQIDAQLQNQHQLELEQRERAAAAMAAINAANKPVMTNCNYFGSTISCTSN